jgi:hypothetical protein
VHICAKISIPTKSIIHVYKKDMYYYNKSSKKLMKKATLQKVVKQQLFTAIWFIAKYNFNKNRKRLQQKTVDYDSKKKYMFAKSAKWSSNN